MDDFGKISLAFNPEGTWYDGKARGELPAHACLYREDLISKRKPAIPTGLATSSLLWRSKSLADVTPEVSLWTDFQTLTIVSILEKKLGIELRGHYHGQETYFHGTEEQLAAVVNELRTNTAAYQHNQWAK